MFWIVGLSLVYLLGLLAIAWISLHPYRIPIYISPESLGAEQSDVAIESDGETLRGWWIEAPGAESAMILAHGYMMNRCELTPEAFQLWRRGVSCLLLDLRAHGKSGGKRCYLGNRERWDIVAAVTEVRRRAPHARIGLYGSSMGAAACALAMGDDPKLADVLVLDSCYSRLHRAINGWWRFLGGNLLMAILSPSVVLCAPMAGFNPFRIDVSRSLAKLEGVPVLFLHGTEDNLATPGEAQRNVDATPGPKNVVWFERSGHSEGRFHEPARYRTELFQFLVEYGFMAKPPETDASDRDRPVRRSEKR
ncbi:MAG: alpha/beta hydrolase [Fimbriimonas sp.]|nr:alpha/beta hydrolase [Fimbriimonas sp.]